MIHTRQSIQTVAARLYIAVNSTKYRGQLQVDCDDILSKSYDSGNRNRPRAYCDSQVSVDVSRRLWTLKRASHVCLQGTRGKTRCQQPLTRIQKSLLAF